MTPATRANSGRVVRTSASPTDGRDRRVAILLASTLAGIAVGLGGDFVADGTAAPLRDALGAILLAPFTVTCGGGVTAVGQADRSVGWALLFGGMMFWPVYVFLAYQWLKRGTRWLWFIIFLWCAQGFFQVVHRFWAFMSV